MCIIEKSKDDNIGYFNQAGPPGHENYLKCVQGMKITFHAPRACIGVLTMRHVHQSCATCMQKIGA